jgi:hypothetical protein
MPELAGEPRFFLYPRQLIHHLLDLESHVLMILMLICISIMCLLMQLVPLRLLQKIWLILMQKQLQTVKFQLKLQLAEKIEIDSGGNRLSGIADLEQILLAPGLRPDTCVALILKQIRHLGCPLQPCTRDSSVDRCMSDCSTEMGSSTSQYGGAHQLHGDGIPDSQRVDSSFSTDSSASTHPGTRLQHGIRKPKVYTDDTVRYRLLAYSCKPLNHHDALNYSRWKLAMDHEFEVLLRNETWHLVPHKKWSNVINCKWVYKVKKKADRSID